MEYLLAFASWLFELLVVVVVATGFFYLVAKLPQRLGLVGSREHNKDQLERVLRDVDD